MPRQAKINPRVRRVVHNAFKGDRNPAIRTSSGEVSFTQPQHLSDFEPSLSRSSDFYSYIDRVLNQQDNRLMDLQLYKQMDEVDPESSAALDLYADNSTQIGVTRTDASRGLDNIVQIVTANDELRQFLEAKREYLRLDNRAWALARDLARMGDVFEEVVIDQDLTIDRLKQLPSPSIIRNENDFGVLDGQRAFLQLDKDRERVVAAFEDWEVIHFRLQRRNEDQYGTSILYPIRRVFKQLQLIEDSMVVARLTRATSKLVFKVDTGGMTGPQAREHVRQVRDTHRKRRLVDPTTGQLRLELNPLQQEEDIFIGHSKGSQAGVEQLYGDLNIGNLTDVEHFQNKKLGGLHVPKGYLGLERDISSRSTLTSQDIQFARSVRRIQLAMRIGYHQLFDLALLLEAPEALKRDIQNAQYRVSLPAMQTVDEMREWEVTRIMHEIARIGVQELLLDPVEVYVRILGYTRAEAEALFLGKDSDFAELQTNKNSARSAQAQADKKFAKSTEGLRETILEAVATTDRSGEQVLRDLRDLCDARLEELTRTHTG